MFDKVTLEIGTTNIHINYKILDVSMQFYVKRVLDDFCRKRLTSFEYIKRLNRFVQDKQFFVHDNDNGEYIIPISYLLQLEDYFAINNILFDKKNIELYTPRQLSFSMSDTYSDRENQLPAIKHLSETPKSLSGLELQTGCLSGDTIINFNRCEKGFKQCIAKAYRRFNKISPIHKYWESTKPTYVRSLTGTHIQLNEIDDIIYSGKKITHTLILENGNSIRGTSDHKIMTKDGFIPLISCLNHEVMVDSLNASSTGRTYRKNKDRQINVSENHPYGRKYQLPWKSYRVTEHILIYEAYRNNMSVDEFIEAIKDKDICKTLFFVDTSIYSIHHIDFNHYNNDPTNLSMMLHKDHLTLHSEYTKYNFNQGVPQYSKAVSIKEFGIEDTYDISCKHPHHNFVANGIVVHNSGKTVVTIRSCVNMNMTTMIVVDGLVTQWYAEFKRHTKVDKNIYVIQEFKSIKTLLDSDLRPEIFICSLSTIRSYIKAEGNYADILPYKEFVKKYGIGIKVSDEAHLCFHATCMIDLAANIPHNIYLTATFENANTSVRRIFKTYFPDHFRFGGEDYEKYTNSFFYAYRGTVPEKRCSTPRGYNHSKYEEFLLKHPKLLVDWLDRILMPIVNIHYVNKKYINKKLLIFCATIEMAQTVVAFLKDRTEGYNVVSKVDDDSEDNFINGDIIVSTHKGSGTGRHIEGLMVVINTVSFQASTLSKQVMGRLRKPKDGSTPEYVDMFDTNINAHTRHYNERGPIIKDCSLSYKEYRI